MIMKIRETLMDQIGFLYLDLIRFLEKEGKLLGAVKANINSLKSHINSFDYKVSEDLIVDMSKCLYILRPTIYDDFNRLKKYRIHPSDRIVIMMKRYLDLVGDVEDTFPFKKELELKKKIINKMYDQIRHKFKNDQFVAMNKLVSMINKGKVKERFGREAYTMKGFWSVEYPQPKEIQIDHPKVIDPSEMVTVGKELEI